MMRLQGQVAVVTGAGRGLGRTLALACGREGASVVLVARTADDLDETAWLIEEVGGTALAVSADVRDAGAMQEVARHTRSSFGRVDILVTSAGVGVRAPITDLAEAAWDAAIDTLLKGTYLTVTAFMPYFLEQKHGHIVTLAAPLDKLIVPGFAAYTAAKYGVEGLTRVLAREVRPKGIAVNGLHPGGFVETALVRSTVPEANKGLLSPEIVVEPFLSIVTQPPRSTTGQLVDAQVWHREQGNSSFF
jgi:3-oxoacyl-[acyl-carrier protein] reductase